MNTDKEITSFAKNAIRDWDEKSMRSLMKLGYKGAKKLYSRFAKMG